MRLACFRPGQLRSTLRCASRNSWSRPGFTLKRTALNAVIDLTPLRGSQPPYASATPGKSAPLLPRRRRQYRAGNPVAAVAARVGFIIVGLGVDHQACAVSVSQVG